MRYLILFLFLFSFLSPVFAQGNPIEAKIIRVEDVKDSKKISLTEQDSKAFQLLIDKANKEIEQTRKEADLAVKLAEQTAKANNLEVQNYYLQLKDKYKIDSQNWDFNFEKKEWFEKARPAAIEKEKQEKKQ